MFPGGAGSGRHSRFVAAVRHYSIDTASELLSETLVEACKESGRKARGSKIYCKPQNRSGRGTNITRAMCFPGRGTKNTRNVFPR